MPTKHPADDNQHSKAKSDKPVAPAGDGERAGGQKVNTNRGNFANNRERAREAGRKGGKS